MSRRALTIAGSLLAVVVVIAVVVIVATGEESDGSTAATPTAGAPSQELQDCFAEQGVEAPEGGPTAGGLPSQGEIPSGAAPADGQLEAMQACAEFLPDDLPTGGFP